MTVLSHPQSGEAIEPVLEVEVTAVAGNGFLLAGFDRAGSLKTLTAPHIDYPQHLRHSRFGIALAGDKRPHPSVAQSEREIGLKNLWLDGESWRHEQAYIGASNVVRTFSTLDGRLQTEQRGAVIDNAVILGIALSRPPHESVTVTWEVAFRIGGQPLANALRYSPDDAVVLAYHREHALALTTLPRGEHPLPGLLHAEEGACSVEVRLLSTGPAGGATSLGAFEPVATVGEVSAQFVADLRPGRPLLFVIVWGSPDSAGTRLRETCAQIDCESWPSQLDPPATHHMALTGTRLPFDSLDGLGRVAQDCYERSLSTIAQLTDRSGAILAGPPIDERFMASGGYAFCWPRDGAFIAHALDVAGQYGPSRAFFEWALVVQPSDGIWKQRYYADGAIGPCWTEHQLDGVGTLLWAFDHHLTVSSNESLVARALGAAERAYEAIVRLGQRNGWPPVSQNLWEDQDGPHLYTLATLLAGSRVWRRRAEAARQGGGIRIFQEAEAELQKALDEWPVDPKTGALARTGMQSQSSQAVPDFTPDASLLGLSVPFAVLAPADERLRATVRVIADELSTSGVRIRRYKSDRYRGGNAWPLLDLWLAWHQIRAGQRDEALRLYRQALSDRTPNGLFPEQSDVRTGRARWVVPLAWAHAWFLLVTHALIDSAG